MKRRLLLALILIPILLLVFAVPAALAAPERQADCPNGPFDENGEPRSLGDCECNYSDIRDTTYCLSGEESLAVMLRDMIRMWMLSAVKGIASLFWLLMRITVVVCNALLTGELWENIRTAIIGQLEEVLGGRDGVLAQLIGSPDGLFAIALMLAGLVMCFPLLTSQTSRLVKVERVCPGGFS